MKILRRYLSRSLLHKDLPALVLFFCLAVISTWPLALHSNDHIPLGTEAVPTVPLFNLWTVWWNVDRLTHGYTDYWDAPIFYPDAGTFSYSEPQPLTVAAAPVAFAMNSVPGAYNCLVLFALCLNGWVAYRLLREIEISAPCSMLGGGMMTLLPLIHSWIGVLQLIPLFGILSVLLFLVRLRQKIRISQGALLGVSLAMTYLLCSYYGLFLLVTICIPTVFLFWKVKYNRRLWISLAVALIIFFILIFPVVMEQWRRLHQADMGYDISYLRGLSAHINDYLFAPLNKEQTFFNLNGEQVDEGFRLCPGYIKLVLALLGITAGVFSKHRRWTLFCCAVIVISFLLSLGLNVKIGTFSPYILLLDNIPGLVQARNIFRFSILIHVMIVLLAAQGVYYCMILPNDFIRHRFLRWGMLVSVIFFGALAALENSPRSQPLYALPSLAKNRVWLEWIKNNTGPNSVVVCVPFPYLSSVAAYEQETIWMYWQTFHHRKMLNGYSGFFPPHFLGMKWPMAEFPASTTIDDLIGMGISYCLVKKDTRHGVYVRRHYHKDQRLSLTFSDSSAGVDIYTIRAREKGI